jgi:hypothetical protein
MVRISTHLEEHQPFFALRHHVLAHGTTLAGTMGVRSAVLSLLVSALGLVAADLKVRRLV